VVLDLGKTPFAVLDVKEAFHGGFRLIFIFCLNSFEFILCISFLI